MSVPAFSRILITGANRGIGLAHVRRWLGTGVQVIAAVRAPDSPDSAELRALADQYAGQLRIEAYDAALPDAADQLRARVGELPIDLVFANAGMLDPAGLGGLNAPALHESFQVNTIAPILLAQAFASHVKASTRKVIAVQSSLMGSIADNGSGGYYGYRMSKTALNMGVRSLSHDLAPFGVTVVTLHPGWVQTRMGGGEIAPVTIAECVAGQGAFLDTVTTAQSGRFVDYRGRELPW